MTRFLKQRLVWLLLIVAAVAGTILYALQHDTLLYDTLFHIEAAMERGEALREKILAHGALAPVLYIGLQILQVVLAPIPGEASGALGGYLFGGWAAFIYSTIGLSIGSWLAFAIGRILSDLVRKQLERARIYQRFNHLVCKGDFVVPFVLFIIPGFPKDSLSYLLGLSHMPLPAFLFVAIVGRLPGTLLLSYQGADLQSGNYLRLGILLAVAVAVTLPCYLSRHRILAFLARHSKTMAKEGEGADYCRVNKHE
ncbi:MAG: TVP38/TMEM64 family protein [Thermodesulfobacteriota bacterium]